MTTLYIIGNGFDLWHELPTGYCDFYQYAKDLLDEIQAHFMLDGFDDNLWHDFENNLGTFDWRSFFDDYNHVDVQCDSFRPSDVYGLEDELKQEADGLVSAIEESFHEWISSVDLSNTFPKIVFEEGAMFLTFNYTNTLQEVYGISNTNIFHIHGNAAAYDKLIFGHGESREEEPEIDEQGNSNRTMFTDAEGAAKYPFYAFKKPVKEVIDRHRTYFASLSNVTKVVIIGHSLSDIDLLYLEEVARNAPPCPWVVYCYSEADVEHHPLQLEKCGVNVRSIKTRGYT